MRNPKRCFCGCLAEESGFKGKHSLCPGTGWKRLCGSKAAGLAQLSDENRHLVLGITCRQMLVFRNFSGKESGFKDRKGERR